MLALYSAHYMHNNNHQKQKVLTNAQAHQTKWTRTPEQPNLLYCQYSNIKTSAIFYVYYSKMSSSKVSVGWSGGVGGDGVGCCCESTVSTAQYVCYFVFVCACWILSSHCRNDMNSMRHHWYLGCWILTYGCIHAILYYTIYMLHTVLRTMHYLMKYFPLTHILHYEHSTYTYT